MIGQICSLECRAYQNPWFNSVLDKEAITSGIMLVLALELFVPVRLVP